MTDASLQVTQLGREAKAAETPELAVLERVPNPQADTDYVARFTVPEFTSLCPVTGQPDFAHLVIEYVPGDWLVESKSLKLYLTSFRNHGAFHEDCTVSIGRRLVSLLEPRCCGSADTGIPAAAFRLTCSGRPGLYPGTSGCPTQVCRPIGGGDRNRRQRTCLFQPNCRLNARPAKADEVDGSRSPRCWKHLAIRGAAGRQRAATSRSSVGRLDTRDCALKQRNGL